MVNEHNQETIEILSEMRSEYNCFGDPEEASRYHALSEAIKAVAERDYTPRKDILREVREERANGVHIEHDVLERAKHALDEAKRLYGEMNVEVKPGSLLDGLYKDLDANS